MERVFMDVGSRINLIYAKMLRAMRISLVFLKQIVLFMESYLAVQITRWVRYHSTFGSVTAKTIERKSRTSKSWIGPLSIT
jgi:hypothetical protein